jgi:hypothetical protein
MIYQCETFFPRKKWDKNRLGGLKSDDFMDLTRIVG